MSEPTNSAEAELLQIHEAIQSNLETARKTPEYEQEGKELMIPTNSAEWTVQTDETGANWSCWITQRDGKVVTEAFAYLPRNLLLLQVACDTHNRAIADIQKSLDGTMKAYFFVKKQLEEKDAEIARLRNKFRSRDESWTDQIILRDKELASLRQQLEQANKTKEFREKMGIKTEDGKTK